MEAFITIDLSLVKKKCVNVFYVVTICTLDLYDAFDFLLLQIFHVDKSDLKFKMDLCMSQVSHGHTLQHATCEIKHPLGIPREHFFFCIQQVKVLSVVCNKQLL